MFLVVVLVIVGGVSLVVARTIRHEFEQSHLIGIGHGGSLPPRRMPVGALMTASLTSAVFVPLLFIAYMAIASVRHAIGQ